MIMDEKLQRLDPVSNYLPLSSLRHVLCLDVISYSKSANVTSAMDDSDTDGVTH